MLHLILYSKFRDVYCVIAAEADAYLAIAYLAQTTLTFDTYKCTPSTLGLCKLIATSYIMSPLLRRLTVFSDSLTRCLRAMD